MTTLTDKMQQRIKELNEDLTSAEKRIVVLRMEKATLRKALEDITSSSCDAGSMKGKTGSDWIAASCLAIALKALEETNG